MGICCENWSHGHDSVETENPHSQILPEIVNTIHPATAAVTCRDLPLCFVGA